MMGTQGYTSGNVSEEEDNEWDYRDNDMAARDIINSQRMAICMDEPREAQYMAGFIALQMSRLWGMFEAGEKRTIDAALKGAPACPYHNDLARYPKVTELDRDGVVLPSSEDAISRSQNVRTRTFRTVEERNQFIRYLTLKCDGLYIFYKLWIAAKIPDKDGHCGSTYVVLEWINVAFTAWCGPDPIHRQQHVDSTMRWIIVAFAAWCGPDPIHRQQHIDFTTME